MEFNYIDINIFLKLVLFLGYTNIVLVVYLQADSQVAHVHAWAGQIINKLSKCTQLVSLRGGVDTVDDDEAW